MQKNINNIFDDDYRLKNIDIDYNSLWKSVVIQAIYDYYAYDYSNESKQCKKNILYNRKIDASKFFKSDYFSFVCNLANLNSDYILQNKKKIFFRVFKKKKLR